MNKIIRVLQFGGAIIAGIGCYMVFHEMITALVLEFLGLTMIFTSIQIEERREDR